MVTIKDIETDRSGVKSKRALFVSAELNTETGEVENVINLMDLKLSLTPDQCTLLIHALETETP